MSVNEMVLDTDFSGDESSGGCERAVILGLPANSCQPNQRKGPVIRPLLPQVVESSSNIIHRVNLI